MFDPPDPPLEIGLFDIQIGPHAGGGWESQARTNKNANARAKLQHRMRLVMMRREMLAARVNWEITTSGRVRMSELSVI